MRPAETEGALLQLLEEARLAPDALDPWEGWRVFKVFCAREVEDVYDAASFQAGCFEVEGGGEHPFAHFIRQFSERQDGQDVGVRRVVMALEYSGSGTNEIDAEVWTHDFHSFEEFASVVEGLPQFQALVAQRPLRTEVYSEEL